MKKIVFLLLLSTFIYANQNINIIVKSDFPKQTQWVKKLLNDSSKKLNKMFYHPNVNLPKNILVTIKKDSRLRSIRANASRVNNSINFTSNIWQKDKYRIWIMIHELTNLLASYYGSNGYPSDWWANGRSPFPEYVSVKIMYALGYKQEAIWRKNVHLHKSDHKFFWYLDKKYSTKIFKEFFILMKKYNIDLAKIGKPWPHPDKQRTLTTLSLLSLASNKNLANVANGFKIGTKPKDWHKRHPKIKFIPYKISSKEIQKEISKIVK